MVSIITREVTSDILTCDKFVGGKWPVSCK